MWVAFLARSSWRGPDAPPRSRVQAGGRRGRRRQLALIVTPPTLSRGRLSLCALRADDHHARPQSLRHIGQGAQRRSAGAVRTGGTTPRITGPSSPGSPSSPPGSAAAARLGPRWPSRPSRSPSAASGRGRRRAGAAGRAQRPGAVAPHHLEPAGADRDRRQRAQRDGDDRPRARAGGVPRGPHASGSRWWSRPRTSSGSPRRWRGSSSSPICASWTARAPGRAALEVIGIGAVAAAVFTSHSGRAGRRGRPRGG